MNLRVFGCKRFGRLSSEQEDRTLTASEERFLEKHRRVCEECSQIERTSCNALNMLRMATLEPEVAPLFEDRVIRRLKVQQVKESLNYWSPALVGAGIACIVIFVTLHLASSPVQINRANIKDNQSRRATYPKLELKQAPIIR